MTGAAKPPTGVANIHERFITGSVVRGARKLPEPARMWVFIVEGLPAIFLGLPALRKILVDLTSTDHGIGIRIAESWFHHTTIFLLQGEVGDSLFLGRSFD